MFLCVHRPRYCKWWFRWRPFWNLKWRPIPDRPTDILLTEKKSHYRLICHRNERDICTCIYKIVSLLKSYDNIHGMTYTTKIMLSGIAKIKPLWFFYGYKAQCKSTYHKLHLCQFPCFCQSLHDGNFTWQLYYRWQNHWKTFCYHHILVNWPQNWRFDIEDI